jgi:membrane fusion protein (multidrug efflux system)
MRQEPLASWRGRGWIGRSALRAAALVLLAAPAVAQGPDGGPPPPQAVTVVTLESTDVTLTATLPGRVVASGIAEVRPQVNGIIVERLFHEGAEVALGDPLYRIDAASYEAQVAAAEAQVAPARALVETTSRDAERLEVLLARKIASEQNYDVAAGARDSAAAASRWPRRNCRPHRSTANAPRSARRSPASSAAR